MLAGIIFSLNVQFNEVQCTHCNADEDYSCTDRVNIKLPPVSVNAPSCGDLDVIVKASVYREMFPE